MIDSRQIALADGVPYTFPDDHLQIKGLSYYGQATISKKSTVDLEIEFDYGLGFDAAIDQAADNQDYISTNPKKIRITLNGDSGTARIVLTKPSGGL